MTEILFYHLTESKLEDALPPLLEKSLERGWKVAIQTVDEERRDFLDAHLWTFRDDSFLPHATDASPAPQSQPILLTASEVNGNGANVRFLVDGAEPPAVEAYERIVFMFDGYDAYQLEMARNHWKSLKTEGHALTYWQQSPEGRWQKKA
ncbi:DNA polymerase III subunit chi [Agrobacterium genomosp. 3]|uniref:Putative DNA polymerase III, chi subunit, HolC n=1 Tax=Agrobacterium tomkonis CFBP 6623 TaxID=1183432 RepID=A0A1S7PQ49_9HYPH|nr:MULTISPECIES: DNA polymerase III subunit chi [Rhizobium/Agrobacterium group]MCA1866678.1 DNA polymerase III subunit chi [Agrobacterium tomkonis]KRA62951.1 DNA polymerase III subunit chi [Rhizobium sp. Root651]MCA1877029.1 DNA polymerase III subunit chi [Agrobacterium tumefaciens]MCA1892472.1 DNA polymerase III subunit chi [Agrobacterium tomkonis]QCL88396.1 DNA polymerase III subunit chi [Agrobacterium tumefaciens]